MPPGAVCCRIRKCGLYIDNGGGRQMLVRSAFGAARLQADMPLEHTLFEQVFAVCCNNPCFSRSIVDTRTPPAHSSCSGGEPLCDTGVCDLGLLESLLRVPNTTVREHASLVLQSLFMATPSQLLPALIQQQCLQREPYHVLQPTLCQYIAKQILASYDSGATTPLGHASKANDRHDDGTIAAFVCYLVGLAGNTALAGATPGLAQSAVRSSLCSMLRCHNQHHNLRTPHMHHMLGTAWASRVLGTLPVVWPTQPPRAILLGILDGDILHDFRSGARLRGLVQATHRERNVFFIGMIHALRRAHITRDSLQCPLIIHTYQRVARLWTACSRPRGCGRRRTSAHKAETHCMGVYLASSLVQLLSSSSCASLPEGARACASPHAAPTCRNILAIAEFVVGSVHGVSQSSVLHVCVLMRVLLSLQTEHACGEIQAALSLLQRRCVRVVQHALHLYSTDLEHCHRNMKTLIFNIPCALPDRHYNSILGSMVRNLVRKQPHTARKTHIMIALAALATSMTRWRGWKPPKHSCKDIALLFDYMANTASHITIAAAACYATPPSPLLGPERAVDRTVFFGVLYTVSCMMQLRLRPAVRAIATSKATKCVVLCLFASSYYHTHNTSSSEVRIGIGFLYHYSALHRRDASLTSPSPPIFCCIGMHITVMQSLLYRIVARGYGHDTPCVQMFLAVLHDFAKNHLLPRTMLLLLVPIKPPAHDLVLSITCLQLRLLCDTVGSVQLDNAISESFLTLVHALTQTQALQPQPSGSQCNDSCHPMLDWICASEALILHHFRVMHVDDGQRDGVYANHTLPRIQGVFLHCLQFANNVSRDLHTHDTTCRLMRLILLWPFETETHCTARCVCVVFAFLHRVVAAATTDIRHSFIRHSYRMQELYLYILCLLTTRYKRLHPSANTRAVCAILEELWFLDGNNHSYDNDDDIACHQTQTTSGSAHDLLWHTVSTAHLHAYC